MLPNVLTGHISTVESEKHSKRPFAPAEAAGLRTLDQSPVVLGLALLVPAQLLDSEEHLTCPPQ